MNQPVEEQLKLAMAQVEQMGLTMPTYVTKESLRAMFERGGDGGPTVETPTEVPRTGLGAGWQARTGQ